MRVLWEASALLPPRTGVGRYAFELLRGLLASEERPEIHGVWRSLRRTLSDEEQVHLTGFHAHCGKWPLGPWLMQRWALGKGPLIESLGEDGDLVHGVAGVLPRSACRAKVLTIHDLFFLKAHLRGDKMGGELLARHLPRFAAQADRVIVPSQAVADDCVERLKLDPSRLRVIPHGGAEHFSEEPTAEEWRNFHRGWEKAPNAQGMPERCWLTFGSLHPRKDLPTLWGALDQQGDGALPLLMTGIGMDDLRPLVRRLSRHRGKWNRYLGGKISDSQLRCTYRRVTALVLPSLDEGFGLPALEAMASGCPVICSDLPVFREVTGGHALFFKPGDPEDLAATLQRASQDQDLLDRLTIEGRDHARQFTWARSAEQTLAVYREALA